MLERWVESDGLARSVIVILFITTTTCFAYALGYYEGVHCHPVVTLSPLDRTNVSATAPRSPAQLTPTHPSVTTDKPGDKVQQLTTLMVVREVKLVSQGSSGAAAASLQPLGSPAREGSRGSRVGASAAAAAEQQQRYSQLSAISLKRKQARLRAHNRVQWLVKGGREVPQSGHKEAASDEP